MTAVLQTRSLKAPTGPLAREAREAIAAAVADAVADAGRARVPIALVTVPAPLVALEACVAAAGEPDAFLWDPPAGPAFAGAGIAARIDVVGHARLDELRARAAELWPRVTHVDLAGSGGETRPRLFGGLAFAPGAAATAPWEQFGDGSFTLPRWCYGRDGERAWLTAAIAEPSGADPYAVAEQLAVRVRAIASAGIPASQPSSAMRVDQLAYDRWEREVQAVRADIAAGASAKIVLARRAAIELSAPADPIAVLARLGAHHPGCFRYGFRRGETTFLGATPERLIGKAGARIATQALAGTIAPGRADELLASAKDAGEHELVVCAIRDALAPLCAELSVPAAPQVRALRHMLHLETPIAGVLRAPGHVLDLVEALHPTPAVGGVPTARAVRWIAEREPDARGWYAGPVGWFDAAGDGELAVAIRAGVLRGQRAFVYAGAGIVAGSDPRAEYDETAAKQRALLGALLGAQEGAR